MIITVNISPADVTAAVESVVLAGHTSCTYCMPFENNAPILIARGLKVSILDVWPQVKDYN